MRGGDPAGTRLVLALVARWRVRVCASGGAGGGASCGRGWWHWGRKRPSECLSTCARKACDHTARELNAVRRLADAPQKHASTNDHGFDLLQSDTWYSRTRSRMD